MFSAVLDRGKGKGFVSDSMQAHISRARCEAKEVGMCVIPSRLTAHLST